jgi:catechol 2,3-dioxygenase-like lactoylglutathione lyase family enzyme
MPITGVAPQIRTTDLDKSINFYVPKLGFEVAFQFEDFYAGIDAGGQQFHLKLVDREDPSIDFVADGDHFHLYFTVDDVDGKAQQFRERNIPFFRGLEDKPWGMREFAIRDDQGHVLYFRAGSVNSQQTARNQPPGRRKSVGIWLLPGSRH